MITDSLVIVVVIRPKGGQDFALATLVMCYFVLSFKRIFGEIQMKLRQAGNGWECGKSNHSDDVVIMLCCQAIMDRERQDELPSLQLEWIDGVCLPLYRASTSV